jgi:hypothetical protein
MPDIDEGLRAWSSSLPGGLAGAQFREVASAMREDHAYRETLARLGDRVRDPEFWRSLNPELRITPTPFAAPVDPRVVTDAVAARARAQLADEGYFAAPPLVPAGEIARFRRAVERLAALGYPTPLACLYDEFWRLFAGLDALLAPMLGPDYVIVAHGTWTFHVPAGHSGLGEWAASAPHRDSLGPDPEVLAGRAPGAINLWIPLSHATPANSCIYVVPAPFDPSYYSASRDVSADRIRWQDIRALPAAAGSVLGWSTHLLHWGSRSSVRADEPRMSVATYVQRRDLAPAPGAEDAVVEFSGVVPFERRLAWIANSMKVAL